MRFRSDAQRAAVMAHLRGTGAALGGHRTLRRAAMVAGGLGLVAGGIALARNPRLELLVAHRLRRVQHPLPIQTLKRATAGLESGLKTMNRGAIRRVGVAVANRVRRLEFALKGYTPGVRGAPERYLQTDAEALRRYLEAEARIAGHQPGKQAEELISGAQKGVIDKADAWLKRRIMTPLAQRVLGHRTGARVGLFGRRVGPSTVQIDPEWTWKYGTAPGKATVADTLQLTRFGKAEGHVTPYRTAPSVRFKNTAYQGDRVRSTRRRPTQAERALRKTQAKTESDATKFLREHGYTATGRKR